MLPVFGDGVSNARDDAQKTQQGFWVEGDELPGVVARNKDGTMPRFLIKSIYRTNKQFIASKNKWRRRNAKNKSELQLSTDEMLEMEQYAFCDSSFLGWEHIHDVNGNDVQFQQPMTQQYREALPHLIDALYRRAGEGKEEELEADEEIRKESFPSSSGKLQQAEQKG